MNVTSRTRTQLSDSYQLKKLLFFIFLTGLLSSCHKENPSNKELINGKWKGKMSIRKSTTFMNGNVSAEHSDTIDWTKPGNTFTFDFREDSLDFYYSAHNYTMNYRGLTYFVGVDKLQFYHNPFSFSSSDPQFGIHPSLPFNQMDYCFISELTNNTLKLYDKDTINRTPLIIWEQWNTFSR